MTRDRHQGIRKKKEKVSDEVGYDEYMRGKCYSLYKQKHMPSSESSSNFEDESIGSTFSQSHDERPQSSMHAGM